MGISGRSLLSDSGLKPTAQITIYQFGELINILSIDLMSYTIT